MIRRAARSRSSERGASAVEFALVLPVLAILLLGIIQFSITYNQKQGLHAAAREGARFASLPSSEQTEIQARVTAALDGIPLSGTPTIAITPSDTFPCEDRQGDSVVVTVSTSEQLSIPLVMERTVTLTGRGEFRCE